MKKQRSLEKAAAECTQNIDSAGKAAGRVTNCLLLALKNKQVEPDFTTYHLQLIDFLALSKIEAKTTRNKIRYKLNQFSKSIIIVAYEVPKVSYTP